MAKSQSSKSRASGESKLAGDSLSFHHPLYLHPSDTQGIAIISHVLTGADNYTVWSRAMSIALKGKNKLGFVNGVCKREDQEECLRDQWDRCDAVVLSWLLSSLSKELANGIIFFPSSYHVWMDLQQRFDKRTGSKIFSLHREITSLRQGSSSVTAYFSKLKELWEEQSSMVRIPSCTCESSKVYNDVMQEQKLLQFLLGLNEIYAQARSHILLLSPLPSVNDAYAMIVEDEAQRQLATSDHILSPNPVAMVARGRGQGRGRGRGGRGEEPPECTHCERKGHIKDQCFQIVGYPPNFRGNRSRQQPRDATSALSESVPTAEEHVKGTTYTAPSFT